MGRLENVCLNGLDDPLRNGLSEMLWNVLKRLMNGLNDPFGCRLSGLLWDGLDNVCLN